MQEIQQSPIQEFAENGGFASIKLSLKEMALIGRLRKIKYGELRVTIKNFTLDKVFVSASFPLKDEEGLSLLRQEDLNYKFNKGLADDDFTI